MRIEVLDDAKDDSPAGFNGIAPARQNRSKGKKKPFDGGAGRAYFAGTLIESG